LTVCGYEEEGEEEEEEEMQAQHLTKLPQECIFHGGILSSMKIT